MYKIIKSNIIVEGKEYITYGIYYNETIWIEDVSIDKAKVMNLINLCNTCVLDPIHLNDIVEDFLESS